MVENENYEDIKELFKEFGADFLGKVAAELKSAINEDNAKIKICILGQPGAGKSSLINAVVGRHVCDVGVDIDRTVDLKEIAAGNNYFLVDTPGYGTELFPPSFWEEKFHIADFDLFIVVFDGKMVADDVNLFRKLKNDWNQPVMFVRNKTDQLYDEAENQDLNIDDLKTTIHNDLKKQLDDDTVELIFVSSLRKSPLGKADLLNHIAKHLNAAKREKFIRESAAYTEVFLKKKYDAVKNRSLMYSGLSAAAAAIPVPGLIIAADIGLLAKAVDEMKKDYGLTEKNLKELAKIEKIAPVIAKISQSTILKTATENTLKSMLQKEAQKELIKKTTTETGKKVGKKAAHKIAEEIAKQTAKQAKYIPIIGTLFASSVSFGVTLVSLNKINDELFELAKEVLDAKIAMAEERK